MVREERDVGNTFAKRREFEADHVDSIEKVLPKLPFGHSRRKIFIRRKDDTCIHFFGLSSADRLELKLLKDSKQFHLQASRSCPDFVEEDRPAVRLLELTNFICGSPRESALNMTKQFAFKQVLRESSASDFHKRMIVSIAETVNGPGDQRLPSATLTRDQNRRASIRDTFDHVENSIHSRVIANDILQAEALIKLCAKIGVFPDDLALMNRPIKCNAQLFVNDGFR